MKNKKGFTLIELLAVIVILAIIALIATPIILNMINEARKSAAKSSTLGYVDSIEAYTGFRQLSEDADISGYDVDLPTMTNGKVTCTKTSSGWNSECSAFFNAVDKKNKGKSPDTATIIIGKDGKVQSGTKMKYNGYEVNYDGNDAYVGGKAPSNSSNNNNNNNSSSSQPQSFANDNWSTIAANTTSDKYKVGDTKCVALDGYTTTNNNGCENGEFKVRIANKTACTTETSTTACGFVVEFVNIITEYKMNTSDTNVGGYPASELYNKYFANNASNSLYAKLPSDLQSVIIPTTVVSGHGSTEGETNFTSQDKLYLLSAKEVGVDTTYDTAKSETRIVDYYNAHNNNISRVKQYNGSDAHWWLRSAYSNYARNFYMVADNGSRNGTISNNDIGIAPAFRIGTN